MASNKISVLIDVAVDKANSSLKSFSSQIKDADGAANKFKAGAGAAFTSLQQNAGNLAMAGGAALVTFGVKAVGAFQDSALAAGEMRDALGLTSEEASQYIQVADDLGIGSENLSKAIGRMNVAASRTPELFSDIGAELARNADGTVNVNKSFQNTVDALNRIPDATDRANAAQKIFGRGWQDMAELIEMGGKGIQEALDAVEGGKVIDDAEVEKARKFRDTLDELKGVAEQAAVQIGGSLVDSMLDMKDAVDDAERVFGPLIEAAQELADKTGGTDSDSLFGSVSRALNPIESFKHSIGEVRDIVDDATGSTEDAIDATDDYTESIEMVNEAINSGLAQKELAEATEAAEEATADHARAIREHNDGLQDAHEQLTNVTEAFRDLRDEMSTREGFLNFQTSLDELKVKSEEAWYAAASGADNAEQATRDAELATIDLKNDVIDYAEEVGNIPPQAVSEILALIDEGKLFEAEQALANLMRPRTATGTIIIKSAGKGPGIDPKDNPRFGATGGIVTRPTLAVIGEAGPEAVLPLDGAPGARPLRDSDFGGGGSSGPSISLVVNAGLGADGNAVGRQIVDVLNQYYRNGGQRPT